MKTLFFLFFSLSLTSIFAQTPLIAHKSHSGSALNYFIEPSSNFGRDDSYDPPSKPIIFDVSKNEYHYAKINDTLVYRITQNGTYTLATDTIKKPKNISFRRFNKLEEAKQIKERDSIIKASQLQENTKLNLRTSKEKENGQVISSIASKSKNKPSFLLIFFAVSALGIIVIRLFRSPVPVSNPMS